MSKSRRSTITTLWLLLCIFTTAYAHADEPHKDSDQHNPSTEGNTGLEDSSQINPSTDSGTNGHGDSTENNPSFETSVTSTTSYEGAKASTKIYELSGKEREIFHHGINIVKMSDGKIRKVMVR